MKPTTIKLLDPKTLAPGVFKSITSTDTFEGMTQNLNVDGLYSPEIFGKLGSKQRDEIEAVIDTKLWIFNPTYFKAITQLKSFYLGILKGTEYAIWDKETKDFIKSNILDGQTGFSFFVKHLNEIEIPANESYRRGQRINLVEKFKDIALTNKILVIPPGLREIQFNPDGSVLESEINELYKKILFRTMVVSVGNDREEAENPLYDSVRWGIQSGFNDVDQYIFDLTDGKGGLFQKRMSTRGVAFGTRNVITARKVNRKNLRKREGVGPNTTDVGLLQCLIAFQYVCVNGVLNKYIPNVFTSGSTSAKLINPKTLEPEYIELQPDVIEKWTTASGLNKLFNGFANKNVRNKPIMISGHYLLLSHDDGREVMILQDVNDLPEGKDKKLLKPITYMEFYYVSCFDKISDQLAQQTRFPVEGLGSTIPVKPRLRTIFGASGRDLLDDYGEVIAYMPAWPHRTEKPEYFDGMSIDPSREAGAGSDHDGDYGI